MKAMVIKMKQEKSCGAVVFRQVGKETEVLLIRHKNGGHWAFPKGHVEHDETETETALREIWEETGLKVALDTGFRRMVTFSPKPGVMKDVIYFVGEAQPDAALQAQEEELMDIRWEKPEDALERVTYENDKETLRAFLAYRKQRQ